MCRWGNYVSYSDTIPMPLLFIMLSFYLLLSCTTVFHHPLHITHALKPQRTSNYFAVNYSKLWWNIWSQRKVFAKELLSIFVKDNTAFDNDKVKSSAEGGRRQLLSIFDKDHVLYDSVAATFSATFAMILLLLAKGYSS